MGLVEVKFGDRLVFVYIFILILGMILFDRQKINLMFHSDISSLQLSRIYDAYQSNCCPELLAE